MSWLLQICLLYTSDAADDMQCVDLGGRRIIKKKRFNGTPNLEEGFPFPPSSFSIAGIRSPSLSASDQGVQREIP